MKRVIVLLITGIWVLLGSNTARGVTRIMPLGDSITKGWYGSVNRWGYRKPLYDSLINGGYDFDLIGCKADGSFTDPNHEGRNGWRADELLNGRASAPAEGKLSDWLVNDQPDIVLLHIGTNDVTAGGVNADANEINAILNVIDSYEIANDRHVTVILALIVNRRIDSTEARRTKTTQYNDDISVLAANRVVDGDDIIVVDMEIALNYDIGVDMADEVHPNDAGYAKMSQVWYSALEEYFSECVITIAGNVREPDGITPVEGMLIRAENNDVNALTDANGFYELHVSYNWSGITTPQKDGYIFEPNGYVYNGVNQDLTNMDYTAEPITHIISGYVIEQDSGEPISGVWVFPDDAGPLTVTDANGYYELAEERNWSGNITLHKGTYVFEPRSRHYENIDRNYIADQNYTGKEYDFRIAGYIKNGCDNPIEGVVVEASAGAASGTTNANGFYEVWVDAGWSGTITPAKTNYTFESISMDYFDVQADFAGQNYVAANLYDLNCDTYIGWGDVMTLADNWLSTEPGAAGNLVADGRIDFLDFAVFSLVWQNQ